MKPKLLFLYYHPNEKNWLDGLYMAIEELKEDFEVTKLNLFNSITQPMQDYQYDFVLGWGAFKSPVDNVLQNGFRELGKKKGLCIAGNTFPPTGADAYDVLFYETKWYRPQINFHKNIVHAFGVNTDIFGSVNYPCPIIWDYLGVGAFASWKRWEKFIDKKGMRMVVGEYQTNNEAESGKIIKELLLHRVTVSNSISPFDLANLYHWTRTVYLPSTIYGGGERALLEARSCEAVVEVADDNPKLQELLNWNPIPDYHWYASQLKKGIYSCLE